MLCTVRCINVGQVITTCLQLHMGVPPQTRIVTSRPRARHERQRFGFFRTGSLLTIRLAVMRRLRLIIGAGEAGDVYVFSHTRYKYSPKRVCNREITFRKQF